MRACLILLFLAISLPASAGGMEVSAQRQGEGYAVQAIASIAASTTVAWEVLTDYEALSGYIPGMRSSKVVSRDGDRVEVDQHGEARLLFFRFPVDVRLAIEEFPRERIESHAVSGNFRELDGEYRLESQGTEVRLAYAGRFTPDFDIPPLIGTMLVRRMLAQRFGALVGEIRRRQQVADRQGMRDNGN